MMVKRLIFKSTKFLEILLILIRFNKICMGSVFWVTQYLSKESFHEKTDTLSAIIFFR